LLDYEKRIEHEKKYASWYIEKKCYVRLVSMLPNCMWEYINQMTRKKNNRWWKKILSELELLEFDYFGAYK